MTAAPPIVAPAPAPAPAPAVASVPTSITTSFAAGAVTVEGVVADEATRTRMLDQAKAAYGAANVVDKLTIDAKVGAPKTLVLNGEVASEAIKQGVGEAARKAVGADGTVDNRLTVAALPVQKRKLDELLVGRTIEFATGSARITDAGRRILDQVVLILQEDKATRVVIGGHTDNVGDRQSNLALSGARAEATLRYLVDKGVSAERLAARGFGPDKPIAENTAPEGQQKNRRIEFLVQEAK